MKALTKNLLVLFSILTVISCSTYEKQKLIEDTAQHDIQQMIENNGWKGVELTKVTDAEKKKINSDSVLKIKDLKELENLVNQYFSKQKRVADSLSVLKKNFSRK